MCYTDSYYFFKCGRNIDLEGSTSITLRSCLSLFSCIPLDHLYFSLHSTPFIHLHVYILMITIANFSQSFLLHRLRLHLTTIKFPVKRMVAPIRISESCCSHSHVKAGCFPTFSFVTVTMADKRQSAVPIRVHLSGKTISTIP